MNYIYDILLNYSSLPYEFFEWNSSDTITHIRKTPIIRVSADTLIDIRDYEVKFDNSFLEFIRRKTEVFNRKNIRIIEEACLFSDGINVIAVMIKNNHLFKSKLLLEEEEEVLAISQRLKEQEIKYTKIKKVNNLAYKTRKQMEILQKLRKQLNKLYCEKNYDTLKYIYYECFNEKEENINLIRNKFYSILDGQNELVIDHLKNILKILEIKH